MATVHLVRIAYASTTPRLLARPEVDVLLSSWRRLNARLGVTGLVLHDRMSVFSVLEGFPDVVPALFATVARDPRHHLVAMLIDEPIAERDFGDWSMGHARVSVRDLGIAPALRALRDPAFHYGRCDEGIARAVIAAFAEGPWRRSIG